MAGKRFYNPGPAITETIRFDNPFNDSKTQNLVAYWQLDAPEKGFFEVPTAIAITQEGTGEQIEATVLLPTIVRTQYKAHGIVMVDSTAKIKPGENIVKTDKEAREMGDEVFRESLYEVYREHERQCLELRSAGIKPRRAVGRVAYALKTLNIEDPAGDVADVVQKKEDTSKMASLEAELAEMKKIVLNMATKGK